MNKTEAIRLFLKQATHDDLAKLYNPCMEVQVNVGKHDGEAVSGDYQGVKWRGWSNGLITWKPFRIPWNAKSKPEYKDSTIKFPIEVYAEGIGMTGWDWKNKLSRWVAFDFDAIVGHSDKHGSKLTPSELQAVEEQACKIPWITVRKSTGGKGLHLYVFLKPVSTHNHTEHAALARSILGTMCAITGFDFESKIDICGGNMWVWHRKMENNPEGLKLVKRGEILSDIPPNWKEHLKVIRRKSVVNNQEITELNPLDALVSGRQKTALDSKHKELIEWLRSNEKVWWWDQDKHMLVAHTRDLEKASKELEFKGKFKTNSSGSSPHNCFLFPMRMGSWAVRRFSQGVAEHSIWQQDSSGWTFCYLNRDADLFTAAKSFNALEDPDNGELIFREADVANSSMQMLGVNMNLANSMLGRETHLKQHKDGRIIVKIKREDHDSADQMPGWLSKKGWWQRIYNPKRPDNIEQENVELTEVVRHIISQSDQDCGWRINSESRWHSEPLTHIKLALKSMGYSVKEVDNLLGSSVVKPWTLVNKPFEPEYPGDREWNLDAAQLRYALKETEDLNYPHWSMILNHIGKNLDEYIKKDPYFQNANILSGADYLKCWLASVFQRPHEPLPYLFLWSTEENTGKSSFHESAEMLMTKGCVRADHALTSGTGYNKELSGAVICAIEETDLKANKVANNRIKDWVTSMKIPIREMATNVYHVPNTTHWVQCSNSYQACPVFPGDTRITMINVSPLESEIPRRRFREYLEKEAADFLTSLFNLDLPEPSGRLALPIVITHDKLTVEKSNMGDVERFVHDNCKHAPGYSIPCVKLYDSFLETLDRNEVLQWSKIKFNRQVPPQYIKGRNKQDAQFHFGNISFIQDETPPLETKLVLEGDKLIQQ